MTGIIAGTSVSVLLLNGTAVTNLVATFTTTGVSVKVGLTVQVSGTTANDFTSPVTYVVTAADGSTKSYTVTVSAHLDERRYVTTPAGVPSSNLDVVSLRMHLVSGSNPFPDNTPVVFLGGTAPVGMSLGTICYATGYNTSSLIIAKLTDSTQFAFSASSQVGTGTCYAVDWSPLHVGKVTLAGDGIIHLDSTSLSVGDTVYLAASPGNTTLSSGVYVVATIPDVTSFTVTGAAIAAGDAFNYIAKVNNTGGAIAF